MTAGQRCVPLGTQTHWGEIVAMQYVGERYYFILDALGGVSMMPADMIEPPHDQETG